MSSTVAMTGLAGYGRPAYAECLLFSPPATYLCGGTTTIAQTISADNATVSTQPGFGIDTSAGTDSAINITGGGDISFIDTNQSIIAGGTTGLNIPTPNSGRESVTVDVNGTVSGRLGKGIFIENGSQSLNVPKPTGDVKITTRAGSEVKGYLVGIEALQRGTGALTVTVDGDVESEASSGIIAFISNSDSTSDTKVTIGPEADISSGKFSGIDVGNNGRGALTIAVDGKVTADDFAGIYASTNNKTSSRGITVTTGAESEITGGRYGISATSFFTGNVAITVDGSVNGREGDGISARTLNGASGGISITTGSGSWVKGQDNGITANAASGGPVDITIGGDVSASGIAVSVNSKDAITLNITGNVFNSSGLGYQSISLDGSPSMIDNAGTIAGYMVLTFWDDKVINSGTWRSTGYNDFSGGDNEVNNTSAGLIETGGTAGSSDTTDFIALTRFINAGTFSMSDQSAGDGSTAFDTTTLDGDYEGDGGTLAIDAFLGGPGSQADELTVKGNSSGTTFVAINNTNGGFATYNPDGILFATVEGMSAASNFMLAGGPLNTGLYAYDVVYDDTGGDGRFLLKNFAGLHAFEVAAVVSGAQSIFFDTTASWVERQNQLRDWTARRGVVVAVADPPVAEDVNETGLWLTVRGTTAERDAEADWEALGKSYAFDTGYDQTTWSLMGGADFGVSMGEGSLLFGVLAGYFNSAQDLNASDTEIDYEGGSLGAYATFLSNGFFASVLGKADFMGIDYSPAGGPDESTDGTNLGLRADAGYRFSLGSAYLEPVASLAAVWTTIDDFELYNTTAEPGTNDAVQLGGGARFGWETASLDLSLTGRVWDAVSGDNEVGLVVPGTGLDTVTDAGFDGVFGEVSGQAAYRITERVAANLSASYLFNENQTALSGAAGVSVSW